MNGKRQRTPARTGRTPASRWAIPAVLLLAVGLGGRPSAAQTDAAGPSEAPGLSPARQVADRLILMSRQSLTGQGELEPYQLTRARILLDQALSISPNDAMAWKLRAELADLEGDDATRQMALANYLKLEPGDQAAQLAFTLSRLKGVQTLDGRVQAVERLLGSSRAARLSAPLRSRLASFAAAGALELGDEARFARWLREAVSLDRANPEAARLTYGFALERGADVAEIGSALASLIATVPLDASARLDLAEMLLQQAAYERSAQQFAVAQKLWPGALPMQRYQQWCAALIGAGRYTDVVGLTQSLEALGRDPEADPEAPVLLPGGLELLRLVAVSGRNEEATAAAASRVLAVYAEGARQGDAASTLNLIRVAALLSPDVEQARQVVTQLPSEEPLGQLGRGLLAARQGAAADARRWLEPIASLDPLVEYALAISLPGNEATRARALNEVVHRFPSSLAGVLAADRLLGMGQSVRPTPQGLAISRLMDRLPGRLWRLDTDQTPWLALELEIEPTRYDYLEPIHATIMLRNLTPLPLAIGADKPLPREVLIENTVSVFGRTAGNLPGHVIDVTGDLTLPSGGRIVRRVRLDRSYLGGFIASNPFSTISFDTTVKIAPRVGQYGSIDAGLLGEFDTVKAVQSLGQEPSPEHIEAWLDALASEEPEQWLRAVPRLAQTLRFPPEERPDPELSQRIATSLAERYETLDPIGRVWMLTFANTRDEEFRQLRGVADQAERSVDPLVRIMYLATQPEEADDLALRSAAQRGDPLIRRFAEATQTHLERAAQAAAEAEAARLAAEEEAARQEEERQRQLDAQTQGSPPPAEPELPDFNPFD